MSFVEDPKDKYSKIQHDICVECSEAIQDIREDFDFIDSLKD
jgi:hypothetical protein